MRIAFPSSVCLFVVVASLSGFGAAQPLPDEASDQILQLDATVDRSFAMVSKGVATGRYVQFAQFNYVARDVSFDAQHVPFNVDSHRIRVEAFWTSTETAGWTLSPPSFPLRQGAPGPSLAVTGMVQVIAGINAQVRDVEGIIRFILDRPENPSQNVTIDFPFLVRIAPILSAQIEFDQGDDRAGPDDLVQFRVRVVNTAFWPGFYRVSATVFDAPGITGSEITVHGAGDYYLQAGEERVIDLSFIAPREKFWYRGDPATILIEVTPTNGGAIQSDVHVVEISGIYVSGNLFFLILAMLGQLALLLFFIVFAKRAYERRYLGRPLPPWEIPRERERLRQLKEEDPRAHYVTRYFLMEEEYQSALLWFYAFKKTSKRQLKAQARSIALREKADDVEVGEAPTVPASASERLQRRFGRRIERRQRAIERKFDAWQGRLERTYDKDYQKRHDAWEKRVEKIEEKANKPYLRARKKWERESGKILAHWERPFKRQKKKHEKRVAKAQEEYEKIVKKKDKPTYKAWRGRYSDWEEEAAAAEERGEDAPPAPELYSEKVGPADMPEPLQLPPKPELPPKPKASAKPDLPPEPERGQARLSESRFAKKARRFERKQWAKILALEADLASKLEKLNEKSQKRHRKLLAKRQGYLEEAGEVGKPSLMDKVLRRTPEQMERRHKISYVKSTFRERMREARERTAAHIERVGLDQQRKEAELEAQLIAARSGHRTAARARDPDATTAAQDRIKALQSELEGAKTDGVASIKKDREVAKKELAQQLTQLKQQQQEAVDALRGEKRGTAPSPDSAES